MKAALVHAPNTSFVVEEVELDGPKTGEVRIRITASGLCHSDYHVATGHLKAPMPILLGHEAAGIVEEVGEDVPGLKVGDFVVTCNSSYCGQCGECLSGYTTRCADKPKGPSRAGGSRVTFNGKPVIQAAGVGGFAAEAVVHHRSAVKLPEGVPDASAALLGCGVLTGVGGAINRAKVKPGSRVAVIGCGGVGLNVIQGARIAAASEIIAIDTSAKKLELARLFGATAGLLAGPDAVDQVVEMTGGGVDYAFEVIGLPSAMRDAILMLRNHGTAVIIGMATPGEELRLPAERILAKDLRIIASGMGDVPFQLFIPQLAKFYLEGKLKLDELVSRRISLGEINEAYESMMSGDIARSVIVS